MLSGFLITGILYDAKSSSRYFRNFYARRILRIAPLYYAFLMFVLLALPHLQPLDGPARIDQLRANQGWYWTYLVNVALAFPHLGATIGPASNHFWSLAVEEQFYLLWPLAVLVFARRHLMMLCVVLMLTAFGLRVALTGYGTSSQFAPDAAYLLLPTRMDTLAIGAFLALAARGSPGELQRYARFAPATAGIAIVVLASIFVARGGLTTIDPPVETIGFSALALLYASLLAVIVTSPRGATANRLFSNRLLGFFGRYAYGLYVVHLLVAYEVAVRIDVEYLPPKVLGSEIPASVAISIASTAISVALALATWHLFEKPFLKLKKYFTNERKMAPASDGTPTPQPSPGGG